MMTWNMIMFPDANSPIMENLILFHDYVMIIIMMIMFFISYMFLIMMNNNIFCLNMYEGHDLEIIWTIVPMLVLLLIAVPSLRLLYLMEELFDPSLTIKIIGHQWYWSYEYPNFGIDFDSFILLEKDLKNLNFRLLETDNHLILPLNVNLRFILTSFDVIHAWTVPSLGVKMDAIPGRLNQMNSYLLRSGYFFGQCSEICGANHSFMPIMMEVCNLKQFFLWIKKQ